MKKNKYFVIIPLILALSLLIWYFSNIVTYILIASVLSLVGHPLVNFLGKLKIKNVSLPISIRALITLICIWAVIIGFISIFVPIFASQASTIANIDVSKFQESFKEPLLFIESNLHYYGVIDQGKTIEELVSQKAISIISMIQISSVFDVIVGITSSIFVAFFAISFITFFFLKDEKMFHHSVMLLTPVDYQTEVKHVLIECRKLLTRYFLGLMLDLTIVILLITIGMYIVGLKNALIIGFIAGIMNIIPYVGPFIGASLGILIGLTGNMHLDFYTGMLPLIGKMALVFVIVNVLDAIILQPTIYANSVKAHPLEIFLVIMMAGTLAGIPGMILAIPSYSVLRIIAKEFFNRFRLVQKLTEKI